MRIKKKRLSDWTAKTISFGGRLTLIKSVLGSLALYYLSIYRAPLCVINSLESIHRNFFWGGSGGVLKGNKLVWVEWDCVLSSYGVEGLNIGSLK